MQVRCLVIKRVVFESLISDISNLLGDNLRRCVALQCVVLRCTCKARRGRSKGRAIRPPCGRTFASVELWRPAPVRSYFIGAASGLTHRRLTPRPLPPLPFAGTPRTTPRSCRWFGT